MATYVYSLSSDFGGNLHPSQLVNEIENDQGISPTCQYINTAGDDVSIVFSAGLSGGEVTILNSLISSHIAASEAATDMTSVGSNGTKTTIRSHQTTNRIIELPDANDTIVLTGSTATLINKTISGASNTISIDTSSITSGTLTVSQGGTGAISLTSGNVLVGAGTGAVTTTKAAPTGDFVGTTDTQTLTNKTLTSPTIANIVNTGTLTLPTSTDTLVGRDTTDTLTNKTLTATTNAVQARSLSFDSGSTIIFLHAQPGPPSIGSVLTTNNSNTARFVAPWVSSVVTAGSTVQTSTTSTGYVDMNSMSVTAPVTGVYLICWNTTVNYTTSNQTIRLSVFIGGTQNGPSTVLVGGTTNTSYNTPASGTFYANVNSGNAVVLKWTISGGTAICWQRSISLILLNT